MRFAVHLSALAAALLASAAAGARQDPAALVETWFPAPQATLATPGFARLGFTAYEQFKPFLEQIAQTPGATLTSLLTTAQGREVWAVRLARPQAKLRVMVIARVHGNEPAASEGALELLAALTGGELKDRTDALEFVIVPLANPDGAAAGRRATARGGDINRDFTAGQLAETRALLAEVRRFDPHLVVDLHEFTVWGRLGEKSIAADLLSTGPNEPNLPPELVALNQSLFERAIASNLEHAGLRHGTYQLLSQDKTTGELRVAESATTFRSAKNFHAMGGRLSLLLEGRGIGLGDQNMARRSLAQYLALKAVVGTAQAQAELITDTVARARTQIAATTRWQLGHTPVRQRIDYPLVDGPSQSLTVVPAEFINRSAGAATQVVAVPRYYLLPQTQSAAIEALARMGVAVRRLDRPLSLEVGVQTATRFKPDGKLFKLSSRSETTVRHFAAGDAVIDTRQPAQLYLQVLEAASPDSLAASGFFGTAATELPVYRYDGEL